MGRRPQLLFAPGALRLDGGCKLYREAGRLDDALAWAERGLAAFPEGTDVRLRELLAGEYHRRGRHDEAVALAWSEFSDEPGLDSYRRMKAHATKAERWDEWRGKALGYLRSGGTASRYRQWAGRSDPSVLVEVFLWEGDAEAAWAEAIAGRCSEGLWMQLAASREGDHPADAVPGYRKEVERLIDERDNWSYEEAVRLMRHIGELMDRSGDGGRLRCLRRIDQGRPQAEAQPDEADGRSWVAEVSRPLR
jgi:uncharacterized Zn finger protein